MISPDTKDAEHLEQEVENISKYLEGKGLYVMQATLERLVMAYVSLSSDQHPTDRLSETERKIAVVINRLRSEGESVFANTIVALLEKTKNLSVQHEQT